jgi:hypothetical protein
MRTKKRTLVTTKVFGFNPWMDQLLAINQMIEATGQKSEAPILRDLVDEALVARRRKVAGTEAPEQPAPGRGSDQRLDTIQTLLLRLLEQGHSAFRVQRIGLELLQENLVETRAGGIRLWETLTVPSLKERGSSTKQIADLFDAKTDEAKDFAYGLAEEIRDQIDAAEADSASATVDDDRQGRLVYDDSDPVEDTHADVA